jgi:hypothetical protein
MESTTNNNSIKNKDIDDIFIITPTEKKNETKIL